MSGFEITVCDLKHRRARRFPGEFVFVPKQAAATEGEGSLMGFVVNMASETTDLGILDAQNFAGTPQAVVKLPHRVPPGFHGNGVPAQPTASAA